MMTAAKDDNYTDTSQGLTRRDLRLTSRPVRQTRSMRHDEPSRPLADHPGAPGPIQHTPRIPRAQSTGPLTPEERERRRQLSLRPTDVLRYPQPLPDYKPQPLGPPEGGRQLYSIDDRLNPGVAGFHEMRAELQRNGSGNLWRIWTNSGNIHFENGKLVREEGEKDAVVPMTFEQICRLFVSALHARGQWPPRNPYREPEQDNGGEGA